MQSMRLQRSPPGIPGASISLRAMRLRSTRASSLVPNVLGSLQIFLTILQRLFLSDGSPPSHGRRGTISLVLMFQREVAERIVAKPGSKSYSRLSVLAGWRTEATILFDVARSAFVPPPKVTSSVVRLTPRPVLAQCNAVALQRVTEAAFGQRRKMLRQKLEDFRCRCEFLLERAGIDPTARAEEIPVDGFVDMANIFCWADAEPHVRSAHANALPIAKHLRCAPVRNHRRSTAAARAPKSLCGSSVVGSVIPICTCRMDTFCSATARNSTCRRGALCPSHWGTRSPG